MYSDRIDRALHLSFAAHERQYRDHRNPQAPKIPYIAHPVGVAVTAAGLLRDADLSDSLDDIMSACLTHDVLEDSTVSLAELERATSNRTASIVLALTKPSVSPSRSSAERNAAFLQQIIAAGPTPCFIKVCDAIHNMSRPQSIPLTLLRKTVRKASQDYLKLADNPRFGAAIKTALSGALKRAQAESMTRSENANPEPFKALDQAMQYALEKARAKVLETHDIADILQSIAGTAPCFIGTIEQYVATELADLRSEISERSTKNIVNQIKSGRLDLRTPSFERSKIDGKGWAAVLCCEFDSLPESRDHRYAFLPLPRESESAWLSPSGFEALVSILSERLRDRQARRISQISEEISRLELSLDPWIAAREQLTYEELQTLKAHADAAHFVYQGLAAALRILARSTGLEVFLDRIEGRVKSPQSIIEKLKLRKLTTIDEIEDLVGIRLIILSEESRARFVALLVQELGSETSELARSIPVIGQSVEHQAVKSSDGYRAEHLVFRAKAPTMKFGTVSCELQLRTIFEDAWARVSQMKLYKRRAGSRAHTVLEELAKQCSACDRLVSTLK